MTGQGQNKPIPMRCLTWEISQSHEFACMGFMMNVINWNSDEMNGWMDMAGFGNRVQLI